MILVLGGTGEGREIATVLAGSPVAVVSSLAGRVAAPRLPPGEVRVGGFGGVDGLAGYLVSERISAVVDATHPFAARITANAAAACARTSTPLLVLRRPPWTPGPGDRWTVVTDLAAAALLLERACSAEASAAPGPESTAGLLAGIGPDAAVLLTVGRQGVEVFSAARQRFWLRAVDPPDGRRPARCEVILDRGPFTVAGELDLLRRLRIDVLVTKNSGGPMTVAKLTAARKLHLPVIVVDRPPLPPGVDVAPDAPTALAWLERLAT